MRIGLRGIRQNELQAGTEKPALLKAPSALAFPPTGRLSKAGSRQSVTFFARQGYFISFLISSLFPTTVAVLRLQPAR